MSGEGKVFRSINVECDIKSTFDFVLGAVKPIGHVHKIIFPNGGKELVVDTPLAIPMDPSGDKVKQTMGVEVCSWAGGPTDPVNFTGRLSPENVALLQEALSSLTGGSEIEISWTIYSYDYTAKKYFKYFHSNDELIKFVVTKDSIVSIAPSPATDVTQPVNFEVGFSITPKSEEKEQDAHIAYAIKTPFVRRMGVPVGA